jgi:hypothetical protein
LVIVQQAEKLRVSVARAVAEMVRVAVLRGVREEVAVGEGQGVEEEEGQYVTVPLEVGDTEMEKVLEGVAVLDRVALWVGVLTSPHEGVLVGEGMKLWDPPTWDTLGALVGEEVGVREVVPPAGEGEEEGLAVLDWVTDMVRLTAGVRD